MFYIKCVLITILFLTTLNANSNTKNNQKKLKKVSLQLLWKHQFEFAGFYIAKEKGFYKEVGLDVELKEFNFGIKSITEEIESSKSTFGVGYPSIILDKSNGKDIVLLNSIFQSSPHVFVSLKSSGIKSINEFKNKRIMINSDGIKNASLLSMLYSHKVTLNNILQIKQSFNIDDLINKKVDICSSYLSNEVYKLDQRSIKYDIWNPKDYGFDFYNNILFTSTKELNNNPKEVESFRLASLKGWEYAFNNIDESIDLILKKYNSQNKTRDVLIHEAKVLKKLAYENTKNIGKIETAKIKRIYDIYNLMGLAKNKIDFNGFIYQPPKDNNLLNSKEKYFLKNKKIIRMCNNPNWEPIEFAQDGDLNKMSGIAIDTLKLIEQKIDVKFVNVPTKNWNQSQQYLKEKKCDILPCAVKTAKREEYANFTKPYLKLPLAIFTTKDKPLIASLDDIIDQTWARKNGSGVIATVKKEFPNTKVIETKDNTQALQSVNSGNVYFTIATIPVASSVISKNMLNNLQIAGYTNMMFNLSIAVRDDEQLLLSSLNKALENISKDEAKDINKRWVNNSVKETVVDYKLIWNILIAVFVIILFFVYKQYMLNKSLKEFDELIDATMEGILIFKDGICIDANKSALDLFGYDSKKDIIGKETLTFIAPESEDLVNKKLKLDALEPYEAIMLKTDGTKFNGLLRGHNLKNKNVRLSSIIDITTLKQQENILIEQSRMAAMGEMIGNIAHQWRQPLSVISTGATGLKVQKEFDMLTDKLFDETCEAINENAQYLSKTIDDFRNFIKGDRTKKEFNVKENIDSFIKLVEGSIKIHNINLIVDVNNNLNINGFANELLQCYINIFNNSKDILKSIDESNRFIFIKAFKEDNNLLIEIKDSGGGIPKDILHKVFDPYFTTKHKSQGTGLGLHMTYNLITAGMNGFIEAKNEKYEYNNKIYTGASFKITLPIS